MTRVFYVLSSLLQKKTKNKQTKNNKTKKILQECECCAWFFTAWIGVAKRGSARQRTAGNKSYAAGNWCKQWTVTDLIGASHPGLADVKCSNNRLYTQSPERLSENRTAHYVIMVWTFLAYSKLRMGLEQLHLRDLFCVKNAVFLRNCDLCFCWFVQCYLKKWWFSFYYMLNLEHWSSSTRARSSWGLGQAVD